MDALVAYLMRNFDFVLFDTPPILVVTDALAMGPIADAILPVARRGQTPIQEIKQAKQRLDAHKLKCLGVILNGVDLLKQDGYYARQYYHYSKPEGGILIPMIGFAASPKTVQVPQAPIRTSRAAG